MTVSGCADPSTLIKKLGKAGKPAELLAPKGGSNHNFLNDQFQKLKLDGGKGQQKANGKAQKGGDGGGGAGGGGGKDKKGEQQVSKDLKLPLLKELNFPSHKDQKNVKFTLPEDFDDGSDFDDDDEFDDEEEEDFDDDMDSIYDEFDMNPMLDKKGAGGGGENNGGKKRGGDGRKDGSKNGEKNDGKNNNPLSVGSKKGGDKNEGHHHPMSQNPKTMMGQGFKGPDMGKMDGPTAVQGMVAAAANPYHHHHQQQAQYLAMMTRQQQQMMNGPTVYGQPMGYVPAAVPVYGESYTSVFSDDNTNSSCSIM